MMPDERNLASNSMKLNCLVDSRNLRKHANSRVSTMTCSDSLLACGTFEGGYLLQRIDSRQEPKFLGEFSLTHSIDGISNHIVILNDEELLVSSNDKFLRFVDIETTTMQAHRLPYAVNCVTQNPTNPSEFFMTGDSTTSYLFDRRMPSNDNTRGLLEFKGHSDYGFSCDWSPLDGNLLVTGNQDGSVKLWDRRKPEEALQTWSGSFGSSARHDTPGAPVRNTKFSHSGKYISWAESLDHIGIIPVKDVATNDFGASVQSIDFVGKCIGLNFCPTDSGRGELLVIGVNDCPLGGVFQYDLESVSKSLEFDFLF